MDSRRRYLAFDRGGRHSHNWEELNRSHIISNRIECSRIHLHSHVHVSTRRIFDIIIVSRCGNALFRSHLVLQHIAVSLRPMRTTIVDVCIGGFRMYCSIREHASAIVWQVPVAKMRWEASVVFRLCVACAVLFSIESTLSLFELSSAEISSASTDDFVPSRIV